ncbi:MAG: pilus assembly protein PilB [Leptolyngbyaceae cyanobacterium CRU_2_3]|nr:pilus assembly protein PilB [Leptolyngbyaceae cyanobacterium CRU_2_3]
MASPLDDRSGSPPSSAMQQQILSRFQGDWVDRLNVHQMFILIDGILPFEACLYYQVLPLFLEGSRLNLGMVSPEDTPASEYVRRIVSYLNYSLVPRQISSETLQAVLTAYLNYVGEKQATEKRQELFSYGHYRHSARTRVSSEAANDRNTFIVDSPEDLNLVDLHESNEVNLPETIPPPQSLPIPKVSPSPSALPSSQKDKVGLEAMAQASASQENSLDQHEVKPPGHSPPSHHSPSSLDKTQRLPSQSSLPGIADLIKEVPVLDIQANYLPSSVDALMGLPPQTMLQELLARVLVGGIGRLYFESHAHSGRVLWSQNGVLQSVLEKLPTSVFQGLLDELKQVAHLPKQSIEQSRQAEAEYLYDRARVLLRFRFMAGNYGEEATLQVLRGAALKFYQQQQVTKLERDAMGIARQLQNKLKEIRDRAHSEPGLAGAKFEVLPALSQLLQSMENELDDLGVSQAEDPQTLT